MRYLQYLILGIALVTFSCSDMLDVNNDPTRINQEEVSMEILLPTVCESTSSAQYNAGSSAMLVTHHLDNVQAGYYQLFRMPGTWQEAYLKALNNINTMKTLAEEETSPHYGGVARILEAVNLGLLTDCYENVPYSDALQGENNITPTYDSQEEVYGEILSLLDEGISMIGMEESTFSPSNDDLFYDGDLSNWEKLAHSLKARYMLHVLDKNSEITEAMILEEVEQGFQANEDDFQLVYQENYANPWYNGIAALLEQSISTQVYGKFFIDLMNGEQYNVVDPRLPYIAENEEGAGAQYIGLASYINDTLYNAIPTRETFYMQPTAPLVIMSYSELKFIEAEVALDNDQTRAENAYLSGIESHMLKVGIEDNTVIMDYLDDPAVSSTVDLEHVLKEKYIATVYNPEAWNDMRRHGFDSDLYKGFVEPSLNGRSTPAYRALYPDSEQSRNNSNWDENDKEFTEKMWKDQ